MSRYLIWDFDGTLGFRHGNWSGTLVELLQQFELACDVTRDQIVPHLKTGFPWHNPEQKRLAGESSDDWWNALLPVFIRAFMGAGLSEGRARALAREVRGKYLDAAKWELFDDVLPVLEELSSSGWRHVILTNHVPEFRELVDLLPIRPLIDEVFNSAETGIEKPHPDAFRNVLSSIETEATVWMIGDNLVADVQGATAAGIPAVLVRNRHESAQFQCDSLDLLPSILEMCPPRNP